MEDHADYPADSPWPTSTGRFDDGERPTLYVSSSPEGAVAEFLRRHPELVGLQEALRLRVFAFDLTVQIPGCDVRSESQASAVGFPYERLSSSESDPETRYAECRELVRDVESESGVGVAYPSAAHRKAENFVVFHDSSDATWRTSKADVVGTPRISTSDLRPLS